MFFSAANFTWNIEMPVYLKILNTVYTFLKIGESANLFSY